MKVKKWQHHQLDELHDLADNVRSNGEDTRVSKYYGVSALDTVCVVWSFLRSTQEKDIGHIDCEYSYLRFLKALNNIRVHIPRNILERALCCANFLDEKGKFEHPLGITFDTLLAKILYRGERYDKDFNLIRRRRGSDPSKM